MTETETVTVNRAALQALIDYINFTDEEYDYYPGRSENHIFLVLVELCADMNGTTYEQLLSELDKKHSEE